MTCLEALEVENQPFRLFLPATLDLNSEHSAMPIINTVAAMADEVAVWRRDLHENPELLYDVHRTAGLVAERLKGFGCVVH